MSSAQSVRLPTKSTVSLSCSMRNACGGAIQFRCIRLHSRESKGLTLSTLHSALQASPNLTTAFRSIT